MIDVHHVDACPSKITVFLGSVNCEADAAVYPCDATDQHIEWYSDDPGIATVNPETGHISGVSIGKTRIFAQATNGSRAGIVVEVVPAMIEEIWLESTRRDIGCGEMDLFVAEIFPETARNREIMWHATDPSILSITPDGHRVYITANKIGTAAIVATDKDNSNVSDCCVFNVVERIEIDSVSLDCSVKVLEAGETYIIRSKILPENSTSRKISWKTSDSSIATVERYDSISAKVTGKKKDGVVTITADAFNTNEEATCKIVVDNSREKVYIRRDGNNNRIVFEASDKEWLCINYDLINNPANYIEDAYDYYIKRLHSNTYETIEYKEYGTPILEDPKFYTDNEKKLIYMIDPYGFAAYVHEYGVHITNNLSDLVKYKDSVFKFLFNRTPKYYARRDNGEWYDVTSREGLLPIEKKLSESELYFGTHNVYDYKFWLDCVNVLIQVLTVPTAFAGLAGVSVPLAYTVFLECATLCHTIAKYKAEVEEDYYSYALGVIKKYTEMVTNPQDTKAANYDMSWANALCDLGDSFGALAESLADKPTFYPEILECCAEDTNYRIFFEFKNGTIEEMLEIDHKLKFLLQDQT